MEGYGMEFERYPRPAYESLEKAKEGESKVEGIIETMKAKQTESIRFEGTNATLSLIESEDTGGEPTVVISWEEGSFVKFIPITEGKGAEKGAFGYTGFYGFTDGETEELMPLENALLESGLTQHIPQIRFHLTDVCFAEEKNFAEDNVFDVWVGMGMLATDERHTHIVHHELGHIEKNILEQNFADESPDKEYQASLRARKMTTGLMYGKKYPGSGERGLFGLEQEGTGISREGRKYLQIMEWGGDLSKTEAGKRVDESASLFATNSKDKMAEQIEKARRVINQTDLALLWS